MDEAQGKTKKKKKHKTRCRFEHGFGSGKTDSTVDFNSTWNEYGLISNALSYITCKSKPLSLIH